MKKIQSNVALKVLLLLVIAVFSLICFPQNLRSKIETYKIEELNTTSCEDKPIITKDGKYLFFNSTVPYWHFSNIYFDFYLECYRYDYNIYYSQKINDEWSEPKPIEGVNTYYDEMIFGVSKDNRKIYIFGSLDENRPKNNFWAADFINGKAENLIMLEGPLNDFFDCSEYKIYIDGDDTIKGFVIYGISLSPDENKIYFATDLFSQYGITDIWVSEKKNGLWQYPINLGPQINSFGAINCEPIYEADVINGKICNIKPMGGGIAKFFVKEKDVEYYYDEEIYETLIIFGASISPDNNKFYFATNKGRKYGMIDIWVSEKKDGKWGYPTNLGPTINKVDCINYEPYITPDGKTLYYSTNYDSYFGDMNLFYSVYDGKKWSKPVKLSKDINTNNDDLQIFCPIIGNELLIVRNKFDSEIGNKDIKEYSLFDKAKALPNYSIVLCTVVDSESGEKLDAQITITSINNKLAKTFEYNKINQTLKIPLHRNFSYEIVVQKDGYEPYWFVLDLNEDLKDKEIPVNIRLSKKNDNKTIKTDYQSEINNEEANNKQIRIYPNPALQQINIDFSNCEEKPTWIEIMSVTGERIVKFDISENKKDGYNIDISSYTIGTYIVNIGFKKGYISYKFIKN